MNRSVVDVREVEESIVLVTMRDVVHRNTFTQEMTVALTRAFEQIGAHPGYKAVVLTGYDSYFLCGGTQDGLLSIHEGKSQFTQMKLYALPLECRIPVISAMQGHGIGGGFVMGLFADMAVLGRESVYTANFMKYGFTPGMGATLVLPAKLGSALSSEMLLGAGTYRGADLEKRGIPFPVLPRAQVLDHAMELARQLADKPRSSLITLKDHLTAPLREQLPQVEEQEVAMHEITFHQPEVKQRIVGWFGK